jgi:hypothetical protein
MKKLSFLTQAMCVASILLTSFVIAGCHFNSTKTEGDGTDSVAIDNSVTDSTVYGTCGESTAMHSLELITDAGDTLQYIIAENKEGQQDVQGGLLVGDRLAVIEGESQDGDKMAKKVINLTTLLGKWTSLDKNFEILEGGVVKSHLKAETKPWTSWKILNGKLLLNKDTFEINELGKDSLYLESKEGIFTYKRPL